MKRVVSLASFVSMLTLASVAVVACGPGRITLHASDDDGGATDDASLDASIDAEDDASLSAACGPAPWVNVGLIVRAATLSDPKGSPLAGARFTSPLCPGVARISGADGSLAGPIAQSVAFYGRLEAKNYINMLTPELRFDADVASVSVSMPPSVLSGFIPGFGPDTTAIAIGAMKDTAAVDAGAVTDAATDAATDGGVDECTKLDGIAFSVQGHPEATVTYFSTDTVPQPTGGTVTTASGRATITGLAPGAPVTLVGTKTGCTVDFAKPPETGRAPLEAGFVTVIAAYVRH